MSQPRQATLKGMKEGFYNLHSGLQASIMCKTLPRVAEAARSIDLPTDRPLQVAEFGCSHGGNSVKPVRAILEVLQQRLASAAPRSAAEAPAGAAGTSVHDNGGACLDVMVSHEDLPKNSWSELVACTSAYMDDPSFSKLHVSSAMVGRSFYQRCFPSAYLHLGFSFSSLHWESKRACPLSNSIFVLDPVVPEAERAAWRAQAKADLTNFLKLRAQEFVPGGIMVLCYGTCTAGPDGEASTSAKLRAANAMHSMVNEGLLKREELGNMAVPVYELSAEEQDEVYGGVADLWEVVSDKEYSTTDDREYERHKAGDISAAEMAQAHSDMWRAAAEGFMLSGLQLTRSSTEAQRLLDEFFARTAAAEMASPQPHMYQSVVVVLRRR